MMIDNFDPYVHTRMQELPKDETVLYIERRLNRIPHPGPRHKTADWVVQLTKDGIGLPSVYNRTAGVVPYLIHADAKAVDELTATTFRSHFKTVIQEVTPQVWYERQRSVLKFMQYCFGAEEGARRAPAAKPGKSWLANNTQRYEWEQLRAVWLNLDLTERSQFALAAGSLTPPLELIQVPITAAHHEDDHTCVLDLPANGRRDQRWGAVFYGELSIKAVVEQAKEDPSKKWFFPDPSDPSKHMTRRQFSHLVKTWGKRVGIPSLNAEQLQNTLLWYLLGCNVNPQVIAHLKGVRTVKRFARLADHVQLAKQQGHAIGKPNFAAAAPGPGLVACHVCGRISSIDAKHCTGCGRKLSVEAASEEAFVKAEMHDRLNRLLDLFGDTPAKRLEAAAQALEPVAT